MSRKKRTEVREKLFFMMNKAGGTVCSTVSDRRKTVYEAFPAEKLISPEGAKLHSIGRLDADTEGLLLFTNDGMASNFLTRPENKIEKTYFVKLAENVGESEKTEYVRRAKKGLVLPPEKKACEQFSEGCLIEWEAGSSDTCTIRVTEGKFHEVKRIFRALGNEVSYLKRISFADIELDEGLAPGTYRKLTEEEISRLYSKICQ